MSVFVFPATKGPIGVRGPAPEEERKPKVVSELEKKLSEGETLVGRAEAQGKHITRFTKFAWRLDMLFLFLAVLVFHVVAWYKFIQRFLPPRLCQILEPIYESETLTTELKQWLFCILGLVVLPIVFDIVLSVICKLTPAAEITKTRTGGEDLEDRYHRLKDMLDDAKKELNPTYHLPLLMSGVTFLLFIIPIIILAVGIFLEGGISDDPFVELFASFFTGATILFLALALIALIFLAKFFIIAFFFSNDKIGKEVELFSTKLYSAYHDFSETRRKEKEAADEQLRNELYERATRSRVVNEDLMNQAAELGHPLAKLYFGKKLLLDVDSGEYTDKEIGDICKRAQPYLERAYRNNIPDAVVLYAFIQIQTEVYDAAGWKSVLNKVRGISKAGLSSEYREMYDQVVSRLVSKINYLERPPAVSYTELARRMAANEAASYSGRSSDVDLDLDMVQSSMHAADPNFDWRDAGE